MAKVLIVLFMIFPMWQYSFAGDIRDKINYREYRLTGEAGITIRFSDDLFAGKTGVNYYSGTYEIEGDEIIFGNNIGVTKRMGSDEDMRKEQEYLEFLQGRKKIDVFKNRLVIGSKLFIETENKK